MQTCKHSPKPVPLIIIKFVIQFPLSGKKTETSWWVLTYALDSLLIYSQEPRTYGNEI